jgi:sterol desaturase/sphingolipid hydroxylase (fatty acid hydroxylase superfamily)
MRDFVANHAWLLSFWSAVVLFGSIEFLIPGYENAERSRRWPTNFGLSIINGLILAAIPVTVVGVAQWAADHGVGLLNWISAPWWAAVACTAVVGSLAHYITHRVFHKVPLLWRMHRVHHCDRHLDVSTALRGHPVEMFLISAFVSPAIILFGLPPVMIAFYEGVEIFANMFSHSNIRFPAYVERVMSTVLVVTPTVHRLHHSTFQPETDSNYGNVFMFWDRLFGTYRHDPVRPNVPVRIGLDEVDHDRAGDLTWQLKLPFVDGGGSTRFW